MSQQPKDARAEARSGERRAMLSKIHIAKKELLLDDATYRDIVQRISGGQSAGCCTDAQLHKLLIEFKRLGFTAKRGGGRTDASAQVRMIYGLWNDLKGRLKDGSEAALIAFVRRQTATPQRPDGVASPKFLRGADANRVIEGLKAWQTRLEKGQADV